MHSHESAKEQRGSVVRLPLISLSQKHLFRAWRRVAAFWLEKKGFRRVWILHIKFCTEFYLFRLEVLHGLKIFRLGTHSLKDQPMNIRTDRDLTRAFTSGYCPLKNMIQMKTSLSWSLTFFPGVDNAFISQRKWIIIFGFTPLISCSWYHKMVLWTFMNYVGNIIKI